MGVPVTQALFDYRIDLLGFYPTVETLVVQAVIAMLSVVLWLRARERAQASAK